MKKITLALLSLVLVSSCDDDASRLAKSKAIKKIFPKSRIFYMSSNAKSIFYVLDSTNQLYEITTSIDPVNTQLTLVQKAIEIP
jgi:hypothetical protein